MDRARSTPDLERSPRQEFLGALLCALEQGTRRLAERLEDGADPAALDGEQARLGWGWAVANELAGEGGAPDRREPRGAAWLARCFAEPRLEAVAGWPRVRPEHADWRAAYALVLVTRAGFAAGARRVGRRAHAGGCGWVLEPLASPPPVALEDELAGLGAGLPARVEQLGDRWVLPLPEAWRLPAPGGPA